MHQYSDSSELNNFYEKTALHGESRPIERIYNLLHGGIPTTVNFTFKFDVKVFEYIEEKFSLFSSALTYSEDRTTEEAVWLGKGEFEKVVLYTATGRRADTLFDVHFQQDKKEEEEKEGAKLTIRIACNSKDVAQKLANQFIPFHKKFSKTTIYILTAGYGDLNLTSLPLKFTEEMDLASNYGEDFLEVHNKVLHALNEQESGLLLFNGEPGTGKSSYIKYLCSGIINRKIAYIPVSLINQLTSPQMLPLLTDNKDIVLVLEDAEKALVSRDVSEYTDVVQSILNLTDGLLGGALNVSIIATFNIDKQKIDTAFLRKGRLRVSYEFKKLDLNQTLNLAKKLNKDTSKITEGMTLADIYNIEEDPGYVKPETRRMGFA